MLPDHVEYTIHPGDTLTRIIHDIYGWTPHNQPATYNATLKGVLALNPHLKDPDRLVAGTILRLPDNPSSALLRQVRPIILQQHGFVSDLLVAPDENERVTALAWLARNSNWLTTPGSIATGTASGLLSGGNQQLLTDIADLHAEYKAGRITRTAYRAGRTLKIAQFRQNLGPFERFFYPKGVRTALRPGIKLLPADITRMELERLRSFSRYAAKGGVVLTGIGVTAACMQIAHTLDPKEKNEIFVDTIVSTGAGWFAGGAIGLFLISNPVGWGTAVVLAITSAGVSWGAGKAATMIYDRKFNQIDFVSGLGVEHICHS